MKTLKGVAALLILAVFLLAMAVSIFSHAADARADFNTWVERGTRPTEPCGYCANGTCTECIVAWPGVKGVGNLGIGDGNISLMDPAFINDAMKSFNENLTKNETVPENTTRDVIAAPQNISGGNGALVTPGNNTMKFTGNNTLLSRGNSTLDSREAATESNESAPESNVEPEPAESVPVSEVLLPNYIMAAGVITRAEPYSITINKPLPHILNEEPVEAGVIYGKMFGLPMPDGSMIDIGIKSLGTEY